MGVTIQVNSSICGFRSSRVKSQESKLLFHRSINTNYECNCVLELPKSPRLDLEIIAYQDF